jgi:acetyl esterase
MDEAVRWMWAEYVPDADRRFEPDASPMHAESVADVAPAQVITAEHDIFRGEAEYYARRLEDEGVKVELIDYPGQIHGFYHQLGVLDDARDAVDRSAAALHGAFGALRS